MNDWLDLAYAIGGVLLGFAGVGAIAWLTMEAIEWLLEVGE